MNVITKALTELRYRIPPQVLKVVFASKRERSFIGSVDEEILNKVIRPRVLVDADLVGGVQMVVDLTGILPEMIDVYTAVYKIPPTRVNNRSIISTLSVSYLPYNNAFNPMSIGMYNVMPSSVTDVVAAGQRVMDSHSNLPAVSSANVELVGHNVIMIRDPLRITSAYQLRCIVGNDEFLNNINPRSYSAFAKLVEFAVKSYIFNVFMIDMGETFLKLGQDLGVMKSTIEGWSDAEENYQTYLREKWAKIALMNDRTTYRRVIKLQMAGNL
jgi:hypothetical protein